MKPPIPFLKPSRDHWLRDPLWRMRAFRLACDLADDSWSDATALNQHRVTVRVAGQLYSAVSSIKANIGEGYSRSSGRDRAHVFEYGLGSVRENLVWYDASIHVLGEATIKARVQLLEEIRRLLLAIIPRERERLIRPSPPKS